MGWVLIGMAAYFVRPILPLELQKYILAAVAIAAGIHLGWLDKTVATFRSFPWVKTIKNSKICAVVNNQWDVRESLLCNI